MFYIRCDWLQRIAHLHHSKNDKAIYRTTSYCPVILKGESICSSNFFLINSKRTFNSQMKWKINNDDDSISAIKFNYNSSFLLLVKKIHRACLFSLQATKSNYMRLSPKQFTTSIRCDVLAHFLLDVCYFDSAGQNKLVSYQYFSHLYVNCLGLFMAI